MSISRDREYEGFEASCDTPGCAGWDAFHVVSANEMNSRLSKKGWEIDGEQHYCPRCRTRKNENRVQL